MVFQRLQNTWKLVHSHFVCDWHAIQGINNAMFCIKNNTLTFNLFTMQNPCRFVTCTSKPIKLVLSSFEKYLPVRSKIIEFFNRYDEDFYEEIAGFLAREYRENDKEEATLFGVTLDKNKFDSSYETISRKLKSFKYPINEANASASEKPVELEGGD